VTNRIFAATNRIFAATNRKKIPLVTTSRPMEFFYSQTKSRQITKQNHAKLPKILSLIFEIQKDVVHLQKSLKYGI
jgi:hypothetical protein